MDKSSFSKSINMALLFITCVLLLFSLPYIASKNITADIHGIRELSDGWYYLQNGKQISVTLPASITLEGADTLSLYNDTLSEKDSFLSVTTRGATYQLRSAINGTEIYRYKEGNFLRNAQMRSKIDCLFQIPTLSQGDTLAMNYKNTRTDTFQIPSVYIGPTGSMVLYFCQSSLFSIGIICLMYLLGFLALCIHIYLRIRHIEEKRLMNAAGFLIICGTWCLTDSSLAQFLSQMSESVLYISFSCFMLFGIPMIYFVRNTSNMKKYHSINFLISVFYLNIMVQMALNLLFGVDLINMLFSTHLLLFGGSSLLGCLLIREYISSKSRELFIFMLAFILLAFFGILAMVLYWVVDFTYYQEVFECGILFFIILLLRRVLITLLENFQAKTEMIVYTRLSKEDGMTSLMNRRAFDEDIEALEQRKQIVRNSLLIFFDINRLKNINDIYGHNVGDEIIIATSRCLKKTFDGVGNCYRIGGDEFAVLIHNPTRSDTIWNLRLNTEIRQYNQTHKTPISIACGYSYLFDEHGMQKAISDWKYEADRNMYNNKFQYRLKNEDLPKDMARVVEKMMDDRISK